MRVSASAANPATGTGSAVSPLLGSPGGSDARAAEVDALVSARFQAALAAAWFRQHPELQPLVEAAVQGAMLASRVQLAGLERPAAVAAMSSVDGTGSVSSARSPTSAAAATSIAGDSAEATVAERAQERAAAAVFALLGCEREAGAEVVAGAGTYYEASAPGSTHGQPNTDVAASPAERQRAVAAAAAAIAAQLVRARLAIRGRS
jgi:hypothetical protein